jgi:hypothetical protein
MDLALAHVQMGHRSMKPRQTANKNGTETLLLPLAPSVNAIPKPTVWTRTRDICLPLQTPATLMAGSIARTLHANVSALKPVNTSLLAMKCLMRRRSAWIPPEQMVHLLAQLPQAARANAQMGLSTPNLHHNALSKVAY